MERNHYQLTLLLTGRSSAMLSNWSEGDISLSLSSNRTSGSVATRNGSTSPTYDSLMVRDDRNCIVGRIVSLRSVSETNLSTPARPHDTPPARSHSCFPIWFDSITGDDFPMSVATNQAVQHDNSNMQTARTASIVSRTQFLASDRLNGSSNDGKDERTAGSFLDLSTARLYEGNKRRIQLFNKSTSNRTESSLESTKDSLASLTHRVISPRRQNRLRLGLLQNRTSSIISTRRTLDESACDPVTTERGAINGKDVITARSAAITGQSDETKKGQSTILSCVSMTLKGNKKGNMSATKLDSNESEARVEPKTDGSDNRKGINEILGVESFVHQTTADTQTNENVRLRENCRDHQLGDDQIGNDADEGGSEQTNDPALQNTNDQLTAQLTMPKTDSSVSFPGSNNRNEVLMDLAESVSRLSAYKPNTLVPTASNTSMVSMKPMGSSNLSPIPFLLDGAVSERVAEESRTLKIAIVEEILRAVGRALGERSGGCQALFIDHVHQTDSRLSRVVRALLE